MMTPGYSSHTTLVYPGAVWRAGPDPEPDQPVTVRGALRRERSVRRTHEWKRSHRRPQVTTAYNWSVASSP